MRTGWMGFVGIGSVRRVCRLYLHSPSCARLGERRVRLPISGDALSEN